MDVKGTKFHTCVDVQPARVETIESLEAVISECLDGFYKANKVIPQQIIFLRDGVGEGMP